MSQHTTKYLYQIFCYSLRNSYYVKFSDWNHEWSKAEKKGQKWGKPDDVIVDKISIQIQIGPWFLWLRPPAWLTVWPTKFPPNTFLTQLISSQKIKIVWNLKSQLEWIWELGCVTSGHCPLESQTPGILSCWHQLHNTKCALLTSAPQYKVCNGDTTYKLQYKVYKAALLQYDAQFTKAYPVEISAVQCTMFYVKISIAVFVCIAVFVYLL